MKITIEKISPRLWEWSVKTDADLTGGLCRTKRDASSDAAIWVANIQAIEAHAAGRIVAGNLLHIKPEWQDKGDSDFLFYAVETQLEGMREVRARAIHIVTGKDIPGIMSIRVEDK